jgi:DNA-binding NarL/FixJ family response regulator
MKHTVIIAEDHALLRAGMRMLLSADTDIEVVAEVDNGKAAVQMACKLRPTIVLMDLSMPGSNGMEAIGEIKRREPDIKVLVVTMHKTDEYILEAFRNGASGYILKESSHDELRNAVRTVLNGKVYLSPDVSERVVTGLLSGGGGARSANSTSPWDTLTVREREVLKLVAEGHTNKYMADYLCLSIKTIEKHRSSLMRKLNMHNAAALTAYAIDKGIVSS